jgi:hypothetical protein
LERKNPFIEKNDNIEYLVLTNIGQKIFTLGLNRYKNIETNKKDIYAKMAGETPILNYYQKKSKYSLCIHNNPNNCTKIIKITN